MTPHTIQEITLHPLDLELAESFTVSSGALDSARLVVVRIRLTSGAIGFGEMAPFPAITGETRESSLEAALPATSGLVGQSVLEYRRLFGLLKERLPDAPAARCGIETALLDAYGRCLGIPLWAHLGGAALLGPHVTDITIPVCDLEHTVELADLWWHRGFRRFKLKVGVDVDLELEKIARIVHRFREAEFVVDANGGFDLAGARRFLLGLRKSGVTPLLFEQPLPAEDLSGACALRKEFSVRVVADESARSVQDVLALARTGAADLINLKIMKSGLREAIQMAVVARSLGMGLMIGGMLESRLAMACSFSLVVGLGGIDYLDLDTPLLLRTDPWDGGYQYQGATLLPWDEPGLGLTPRAPLPN